MTMPPPRAARLLLAAAAAFALGACDDEDEAASRFRSPTGTIPATPQRPGDPEKGRHALLNAPYVSCGAPYEAWARLAPPIDPADLPPGRAGRNAELPYNLTAHTGADGVEIVASNCLTCHAARLNGELIVGLGNEFLDFTRDPREAVSAVGAYVRGAAAEAAWARWADRIEAIAPHTRTATVGANPAENLTWAIMAHRDPETLAWSQTPLLAPPPTEALPVSTPPWWGMAKKHAMFHTGIGRGDHARFMLLASTLCADSVAEAEAVDAIAPDIRAFIAALTPPRWPWDVDTALAAEGEAVYRAECADCHGTYGAAPSYPNALVKLEIVGTDPAYATAMTDGSRDRFYEWLQRSPYGQDVTAAPARGYVAPPLDGVWATAPYLHNGSVPDMAALLDSRQRPRFWRHVDPPDYDPARMGWRVERLDRGQDAEDDPRARARIYDTTRHGYGAGGHDFADDLSDGARAALIEYLKTL